MKIKSVLIMFAFLNIAMLSWGQDSAVITSVQFTTLTRGYQKQVFMSPDSLTKVVEGRTSQNQLVKRKLEEGEWDELVAGLKGVVLTEIPNLPSPTSRRAFDGARHSTLTIATKDGKTYTHGFDDDVPHEKLHVLMDVIKKLEGADQE